MTLHHSLYRVLPDGTVQFLSPAERYPSASSEKN